MQRNLDLSFQGELFLASFILFQDPNKNNELRFHFRLMDGWMTVIGKTLYVGKHISAHEHAHIHARGCIIEEVKIQATSNHNIEGYKSPSVICYFCTWVRIELCSAKWRTFVPFLLLL
jgi:hypothetical protein